MMKFRRKIWMIFGPVAKLSLATKLSLFAKLSHRIALRMRLWAFWIEPQRGFLFSKGSYFLVYDHSHAKFIHPLGFRRRIRQSAYYKVYTSISGRVVGYKSIRRRFLIPVTNHAVRIYNFVDKQGKTLFSREPALAFFDKNAYMLYEIHEHFDALHPWGQRKYYYESVNHIVEFLVPSMARNLNVQGTNIRITSAMKCRHLVKKLSDFSGLYIGYDEYVNRKRKAMVRLHYNEDNVLIMAEKTYQSSKGKVVREINRYDGTGKKVNSELYEGKRLRRSAVFLYNEDSKLVQIIQYGPDGSVLS